MNNFKSINEIRGLCMDMIDKANSGHPGICLGASPIITTLFINHLVQNPEDSKWINRDRFILSAGHGSAMLYSVLHLAGYKVSMQDLKEFRQLNSLTPGHPEYGHTDGVDATGGPLGQGVAMAVGMALAETKLKKIFNKENYQIFNHYTYVLCGDGDLQEGVCQEALSFAGQNNLNKLIVLYDSNDIQLDGPVSLTNKEDVQNKYEAMGFNYLKVSDGNNISLIDEAINKAKLSLKPTLIEIKTLIGFASKFENSNKAHGSPLGELNTKDLKEKLGLPNTSFTLSEESYHEFDIYKLRGKNAFNEYNKMFSEYKNLYPELANYLISGTDFKIENFKDILEIDNEATRKINGRILDVLSDTYLNLIGGSADVSSSTYGKVKDDRNIFFGVREHAMASICNGMELSGVKAFCSCFFVFSDYLKPAMRMSALMKIPTIYVFTHDSIMVGEDGPTHEPIEQMLQLRAIPNFNAMRPADAKETVASWMIAIESKDVPTALVLTRQNVKKLENSSIEGVKKGGYIISMEKGNLDGIFIATGSEVSLAIEAQKALEEKNIFTRVVSMPSTYLFDKQDIDYKNKVLPKNIKKVAVELGSTIGWYKYANFVKGLDDFGLSAKAKDVVEALKFRVEDLVEFYINLDK